MFQADTQRSILSQHRFAPWHCKRFCVQRTRMTKRIKPDSGQPFFLHLSDRAETTSPISRIAKDEATMYIQECAKNEQGFDVFQLTAFWWKNRLVVGDMVPCRSLLCILLQIPASVMVVQELQFRPESKSARCKDLELDAFHAVMLGIFGVLKATYMLMRYRQVVYGGLYRFNLHDFSELPHFISGVPLVFGRFYNMTCYSTMCWGSLYLLYRSTSTVDMILNCIALDFVVEIDNLLVTPTDYRNVAQVVCARPTQSRSPRWSRIPTDDPTTTEDSDPDTPGEDPEDSDPDTAGMGSSHAGTGERGLGPFWGCMHLIFLVILGLSFAPGCLFLILGLAQVVKNHGQPCTSEPISLWLVFGKAFAGKT